MKETVSPTRTARSAGAHRINIGLTLLALIFLIVMAAAAGVRADHSKIAVSPRGEPLAILGVTPGSADTVNASAAPGPRRAPTTTAKP